MPVSRLARALAALLVIGLVACSPAAAPGADETATPTPETDSNGGGNACLNTVEEVSAAFGVEVTEAENTASSGGGAGCIYYTDKAAFESAMATSLTVGSLSQTVFDSFAADDSADPVSGIGDEAIWFGGNSVFIVRKGDRVFSMSAGITSAGSDADEIRSILEELARSAADRL